MVQGSIKEGESSNLESKMPVLNLITSDFLENPESQSFPLQRINNNEDSFLTSFCKAPIR